MSRNNGGAGPSEDLMEDIEACWRPVAAEHGREMFELVMQTELARGGANAIASIAAMQRAAELTQAISMLVNAFNTIANAYVAAQGWTEEELSACDRDIQLAFASRLILPDSRIITEH